jgi:peptidoglycan/xylan/chitin deacetylase (PgdA/CDA1 family)
MPATFLIGYDTESTNPAIVRAFLDAARRLHEDLGLPCSLFVTGYALRHSSAAFAPLVGHPLFDLEQHTDSHLPLKTVYQDTGRGISVVRGGSVSSVWADVAAAQRTFQHILGFRPLGLTGPYGYYRGLCDRPDLVAVLVAEGIRFLRTWGRDAHDWQPTPPFRPFSLAPLGFPEVWEYGMHGWQDCLLREQLGWDDLDGYVARVRADLDRAVAEDGVFSYCQHDWSSVRADPEMHLTRRILCYARERGMRVVSYKTDYAERVGQAAARLDLADPRPTPDWQRRLQLFPARLSDAWLRRLDRVPS